MSNSALIADHMWQNGWIFMQQLKHWHYLLVSELQELDFLLNQDKSNRVFSLESVLINFCFLWPDLVDEWLYVWHLFDNLSTETLCLGRFDWL